MAWFHDLMGSEEECYEDTKSYSASRLSPVLSGPQLSAEAAARGDDDQNGEDVKGHR
jgi:hypothetical protein